MIRYKFTEADKTSKIQKHPMLTDEQKAELIDFFKTHTDQHNLIDWNMFNKMTYDEIHSVIEAWEDNRFLPKEGISNLVKGKDYEFLGEDSELKYYFIYTYKASVAFASNNTGLEVWGSLCKWYMTSGLEETNWKENVLKDYPQKVVHIASKEKTIYGGAKWCISMNHTSKYWDDYTIKDDRCFIFALRKSPVNRFPSYFDTASNKYAIELKLDSSTSTLEDINWSIENYFDAYDCADNVVESLVGGLFLKKENEKSFFSKLKSCILSFHNETLKKKEERKKKERENEEAKEKAQFLERTKGRKVVNLSYKGGNFPMVEMGSRAEGKVFGSYYVTPDAIPYSPMFDGGEFICGCSRWDVSILRQWLNSDLPAGQWYRDYSIEGHKSCLDERCSGNLTYRQVINELDGFLRIIGVSKSQLIPVKNKTQSYSGKTIITEDYVWIPSLVELGFRDSNIEGTPLNYWTELLGEHADEMYRSERKLEDWVSLLYRSYLTRTHGVHPDEMLYISTAGSLKQIKSRDMSYVQVLMCLKDA